MQNSIFDQPMRARSAAPQPISAAEDIPEETTVTSLMRKVEVKALLPNGDIHESRHMVPATPLFERATTAFAHGTLIHTTQGPIAVEDLLPGDMVETFDGAPQKVLWIGSTVFMAETHVHSETPKTLTRIMCQSLGMDKPISDLLLAPAARLMREFPDLVQFTGDRYALIPAEDFVDGESIIEITPRSPMHVYHVALERHSVMNVSGLMAESYHPGDNAMNGVSKNTRALFMSMFPHMQELSEFGSQAYMRAGLQRMLDLSSVA